MLISCLLSMPWPGTESKTEAHALAGKQFVTFGLQDNTPNNWGTLVSDGIDRIFNMFPQDSCFLIIQINTTLTNARREFADGIKIANQLILSRESILYYPYGPSGITGTLSNQNKRTWYRQKRYLRRYEGEKDSKVFSSWECLKLIVGRARTCQKGLKTLRAISSQQLTWKWRR